MLKSINHGKVNMVINDTVLVLRIKKVNYYIIVIFYTTCYIL